jgi:hypothetical protein
MHAKLIEDKTGKKDAHLHRNVITVSHLKNGWTGGSLAFSSEHDRFDEDTF